MQDRVEVRFRVRVPSVAAWQYVFVVGSNDELGLWMPEKALKLEKRDNDLWQGSVSVPASLPDLRFRYFVGYYLNPGTEPQGKMLMVQRWECLRQPRCCLPSVEVRGGVAREDYEDIFGSYDGKLSIDHGWLSHLEENVVLLRIHGEALKLFRSRYKEKEHRLKVVPFDVRFREKDSVDEEGVPENDRDPVLPDVPSFSNTELSVLTREDPIFGEQYPNGSVFRNNVDYLVFRTKTVSLENLAFRIELYHGDTRVGVAYALPAALPNTYGQNTFPIVSTAQVPLGQVNVDYMLVKPLAIDPSVRDNMSISFGKFWRKRKTLEVGHRGMGNSYTKGASARENTIHSLNSAAKKGADYVEFDVQLTKDLQPVVYHDFHVLIEVTGRNGTKWKNDDETHKHHEMAVKDLKMAQLQLLHLEHVAHKSASSEMIRVVPTEDELRLSKESTDELEEEGLNAFPRLDKVLEGVAISVGFNVEVKYPMPMMDGTHECEGYFERNAYIDVILTTVFKHARGRRILFSSFDPDICTLISQKQHTYPVLFLVVGTTTRYTPFQDIRSDSSIMAVNYAAASGLLGINFHSEELLQDRRPLVRAENYGLVNFVWGDDLNSKEHQQFFKDELKVDGLIYDKIGEDTPRKNVFLVEKEQRSAIFSRSAQVSPAPSRRNSQNHTTDDLDSLSPPHSKESSLSPRRTNSVYKTTKTNFNF